MTIPGSPSGLRPLALVTGASSGIGRALADCCAEAGYDLVIAADDARIAEAAHQLGARGIRVEALQVDLASLSGVEDLYSSLGGRPVDVLLANAGRGVGRAFLDEDFDDVRHVIDTNVTGTLALIQKVGRDMRARNAGRILITGSIPGYMPGSCSAVHNGAKAFIDSFSFALRKELEDSDVTVTCLMPGATETEFFERADLIDTKVGQQEKDDPAEVARVGFEAMLRGDADAVTGWQNKLRVALSKVLPGTGRKT